MRTTTTITSNSPTTLEGLKAAYLAEVEALIKQYPMQEGNRADYMKNLKGAKLGTMQRTFRSKGDYTVLPTGATVLVMPLDNDELTVFAPSVNGLLNTSMMPASWVAATYRAEG